MQFFDQRSRLLLKVVHFRAHFVLLLEHFVAHLVESVVENFKNSLNFVLVLVQLLDQRLLLLRVLNLQLDELLLQVVRDACQHAVPTMTFMPDLALLAVELIVDLANELDLIAVVLAAEEFLRAE